MYIYVYRQLIALIHHFQGFRICVVIFRVTFITCPSQGCRWHVRWYSAPNSSILHYRSDNIVPSVSCSTPCPFCGIVLLVCVRNSGICIRFHSDLGNVTSSINYVTRVITSLEGDSGNALMQWVEREYLYEPGKAIQWEISFDAL
jgi:hypothetical protein